MGFDMARSDFPTPSRISFKRTEPAFAAPEPEWREAMRDFALMASGVYQDLRGDSHETWRHFTAWLREGIRKRTRLGRD